MRKQMLTFIRHFRAINGSAEINMIDVARAAIRVGFRVPPTMSPEERLAKRFADVARTEMEIDAAGFSYRANQAIESTGPAGEQLTLWMHIDEVPREKMRRVAERRRSFICGNACQLTFDLTRWNSVHTEEEPIVVNLNFNP